MELKGFTKVALEVGEKKKCSISLTDKAFQAYDKTTNGMQIKKGTYQILIGTSIQNIQLETVLTV